jgi:hypothetical protein
LPFPVRSLAPALAALLAAAPVAAQPVLQNVTFWNATSTGQAAGGYWNTQVDGIPYNIYLSTQPNASFTAGSVVNPSATISETLGVGTHTFYFYATSSPSEYFGLNLFFTSASTNASPDISAVTNLAGPFGASSAACTQAPNISCKPGAGTLSFTTGIYQVTLTDFDLIANASGTGGSVNRVSPYGVGGDGSLDNYGRITLRVVDTTVSSVPEPSTWVLLATGGLAIAGVAARKRRS